ncbi:MAG: tetratricopeptide repeat protein, partial [Candidatus Bipolaricaulia bacterium]
MMRAVALVGVLAMLFGVSALGETLQVPEDYPTIQAAIDTAQSGDTVLVAAGKYRENLFIDTGIRLVGEGRTVVWIEAADATESVVLIALEDGEASVEGVTVSGGQSGLLIEAGSTANVTVRQSLIVDNEYGIHAYGSGAVSVERCLVVDNTAIGIQVEVAQAQVIGTEVGQGGVGILLVGDCHATIWDCLIGLVGYAIDAYTIECGWEGGAEGFEGTVEGAGNRVFGVETDLCPDAADPLWPDDFSDERWRETVTEIIAAYDRSHAAYRAQDYQQAEFSYSYGLALFSEEVAFPLLEAYVSQGVGAVNWNLGRYEEALAAFQTSHAVYLDRGMGVDAAEIDSNIGVVFRNLGWYEEALAACQSARAVFLDRGMEINVAATDRNIGIVYAALGRYEEALAVHESARAVFLDRGRGVDAAEIDNNIGNVYSDLGRYEEALAAFQSARAVYVDSGTEVAVAKIDENIGNVYKDLGRYEEALAVYQSARAVFLDRGMEINVAHTDNNISLVHVCLGRYEEALAVYQSARAVYLDREMEVNVASVDHNIGVVFRNLGRHEEALAAYQSARAVYLDRGMEVHVAEIDRNIGNVYRNLGRREEALAAYQSARTVYLDRGMEVHVAETDQSIGNVYRNLGRYEEALAAIMSALNVLDATASVEGMEYSYPATRWVVHISAGLVHEALEEWEEAEAAYRSAIEVIESMRETLTSEDIKLAWQERTQHVYERLVDLLYRMGEGSSAFSYVERCRARTFLDLLAMGPVDTLDNVAEEGIRSGMVEASVIESDLEEVVAMLPDDTVVLEYFVTEEAVYVWAVTAQGAGSPVRIEIDRPTLIDRVVAFREKVEEGPQEGMVAPSPELLSMARDLYDLLIGPVEETIAGFDHLVIVPSGP